MQYQVPQFIDTEDKLVGPFSLRQFAFIGAAGLISAICYFFVQTWLFVIVAIITLGGAVALSFVKINGRPLIKVIISAFNFYWKPQIYIWKADHPVVIHKPQAPTKAARVLPVIKEEGSSRRIVASSGEAAPAATYVPPSAPERELPPVQTIAQGDSLHKSWENLQTGTPEGGDTRKTSDRQFLEKKMAERYQIFQRIGGDRAAARRVDYR
jgi:hypothetical protein